MICGLQGHAGPKPDTEQGRDDQAKEGLRPERHAWPGAEGEGHVHPPIAVARQWMRAEGMAPAASC